MLAWVDMLTYERGGLAASCRWMNCLAPLFYAPRVVGEIQLGIEPEAVCHVQLPLGKKNWHNLTPEARERLFRQLSILCAQSGGLCLAADRRFRTELWENSQERFIFFGDFFRWVLLLVLVRDFLRRHPARRIIFVTERNVGMEGILEYLGKMDTPIMLQNLYPSRLEPFCWRMLHQKGLAVSCGGLHPQEWRTGDLVIGFQKELRKMSFQFPQPHYVLLDDEERGLAPALEQRASEAGLDGSFAVLAPLLEYHLLKEQEELPTAAALAGVKTWESLIAQGEKEGLWDAFLDKDKAGFI